MLLEEDLKDYKTIIELNGSYPGRDPSSLLTYLVPFYTSTRRAWPNDAMLVLAGLLCHRKRTNLTVINPFDISQSLKENCAVLMKLLVILLCICMPNIIFNLIFSYLYFQRTNSRLAVQMKTTPDGRVNTPYTRLSGEADTQRFRGSTLTLTPSRVPALVGIQERRERRSGPVGKFGWSVSVRHVSSSPAAYSCQLLFYSLCRCGALRRPLSTYSADG